jgi:glycosyltransferase involved in cell wall biosynthesis
MSQALPAFSVVIPAWRRPELTRRAVLSVLQQTFADFEVIVVDDASPEPIAPQLNLPADERVRVIRREKNGGGSAARNTGFDAARAPVVCLLDSDDLWLPGKLQAESDWIQAAERGHEWMLFSRFWVDTVTGRTLAREAGWTPGMELAAFLFADRGPMQTSSLTLPTRLAQQIRFDERLPRLQDWDFVLRVAAAGTRIEYLPVETAVYDAPDSDERISSKLDPDFLRRWIEARKGWMSPRAYWGFMANKVAPELVQTGRRQQAIPLLVQGVKHGVLSPRYAAIELLRLGVPESVFTGLLRVRRRLRERAGA